MLQTSPLTSPQTNYEEGKAKLRKNDSKLAVKLASGTYQTLAGLIFGGVGTLIQRLMRRKSPVSYWISALVIAMATFLAGMVLSLALREALPENLVQVSAWAAGMGSLVLIANKVMIDMFLKTFQGNPVGAIESEKDREDLEKWLDSNFDFKLPLGVSLVLGPALGIFLAHEWGQYNGFPQTYIGPLLIFIIASFEAIVAIYYLYPFYLVLPARLSRYRFEMYKADPSSSEITRHLSALFTKIMYITVGYIMLVTVSFAAFKILNNQTMFFLGVFVWAPSVALYLGCQISLSQVISNAKWEVLNEIQGEVESLVSGEGIPSKETLDHLEKLMNYHDRIRDTPNSALNLRAGLNALNSILLPLITLILANWSVIVGLFSNVLPGK